MEAKSVGFIWIVKFVFKTKIKIYWFFTRCFLVFSFQSARETFYIIDTRYNAE